MACPDFQSLTLPVLQSAAGGQELTLAARMRAAHEHARRRRQRLVAHLLAARLGRGSADVCAVAVVDEPRLVDAALGLRDAGSGAVGRRARAIRLALHGHLALYSSAVRLRERLIGRPRVARVGHGRWFGDLLDERSLADRRYTRLPITASWAATRPRSDLPMHDGRTVHDRLVPSGVVFDGAFRR